MGRHGIKMTEVFLWVRGIVFYLIFVSLLYQLLPGEKYKKISDWATGSRFYTLILFAGMVLPLFPDDYFCYLTGLTEMKTRKFSAIIIFGKPWCILAYCMAFGAVLK